MEKIYPLIHLNGFTHMVDKEISLKGLPTTDGIKIYPSTEGRESIYKVDGAEEHLKKRLSAIVASNDPSLNLPLLLPIEEKIDYKGFNAAWHELIMTVPPLNRTNVIQFTEKARGLWKDGYKAASAKKYTEEDLKAAWQLGKDRRDWELDDDGEDGSQDPFTIKEFIQSLNPLPKQVEVEMEDEMKAYHSRGLSPLKPEVENNIIKIIRWIYD